MPSMLILIYYFCRVCSMECIMQHNGYSMRIVNRVIIITGSLLFFYFDNCFSQAGTETARDSIVIKNTLSEVIVSAYDQNKKITRQPAAIFYLSPVVINRFNPANIVSAVNTIPGVQMEQRSPQSYRLNIRGSALVSPFGVRNVKIYYNGIPLTDPGGGTYLNELSPDDIYSFTVIKGPGASLYGAGTGGVVLMDGPLFSHDSLENSAGMSMEAGSDDLQRLAANITWGNDQQKNQLRYSGMSSRGYREQTAAHSKMLGYEAVFKKGDAQQFSITAHYTDLYYQIPGALTLAEYKSDPRAARPAAGNLPSAEENQTAVFQKNLLLGMNEQYRFNDHLQGNLIIYGAYSDIINPTIFNYEFRKEPHFGGRFTLNENRRFGNTLASFWVGGEWQRGYFNVTDHRNMLGAAGNMKTDDNVNNSLSLAFAQADFTFPAGWDITGGAGFHHASVDFTTLFPAPVKHFSVTYDKAISPRIAISKELGGNRIAYLNISSGYSPPAVSQLLPSASVINTNLHPETGVDYELGSRGLLLDQKLYYDIDAFIFNLTKSIATRRDSSGQDYFVNAGGTRQHGVEAFLSYPLILHHKRSLNFWMSGSWFDFRYRNYEVTGKDYSNNKLPGTSPFTFVSGLDFNLDKMLAAHVTYTYKDQIPLNDANDVFASSYNLLDLRIDYHANISKRFNLAILGGINNLLNEKYSLGDDINVTGGRYYNAAPRINFYLSLVIKYLM
ncbi:MAG: TonB-dependent receptor [Chitinophagaceae bacterium]|nr:MAG: TonB-dependent receptor [Chitinophagaceae bacterium]